MDDKADVHRSVREEPFHDRNGAGQREDDDRVPRVHHRAAVGYVDPVRRDDHTGKGPRREPNVLEAFAGDEALGCDAARRPFRVSECGGGPPEPPPHPSVYHDADLPR